MSHRNARLTVHGRLLLVHRVCRQGWPVAHAAKAIGVSRQCAHRWVARYRTSGDAGLVDRSSRPHRGPTRTPTAVEQEVLRLRQAQRRGADWLGPELGLPARTVTQILRRHQIPRLVECDPLTGQAIRSSKTTTIHYERDRPGELVHMDVKKIGRIPDGGGWRAHGRSEHARGRGIGYDYVHSLVDDHSRLAYSEILPDEKGPTCAAFLTHAATYFAEHGITRIERVITDNHLSYRRSHAMAAAITALGAKHKFTKPHCPWQNGKVERLNRTLQTEWAYRQVFTSNAERAAALAPLAGVLQHSTPTPPSAASHRSADCHQPDGRVQLERPSASSQSSFRRPWFQADACTPEPGASRLGKRHEGVIVVVDGKYRAADPYAIAVRKQVGTFLKSSGAVAVLRPAEAVGGSDGRTMCEGATRRKVDVWTPEKAGPRRDGRRG